MISRCPLGLPIRYREDGSIDFTDSAFLTGMLSLFGSKIEEPVEYVNSQNGEYLLVRHPVGDLSNEYVTRPESTSRDQLVAWSSADSTSGAVGMTMITYAKRWFINKDFLNPLVRLYLFKRLGLTAPLYLYPLGFIWMFFDLLTHAIVPRFKKVEDQHEINQALCIYNAFGLAKLFLAIHPSPDENMIDYYCTWRNQCEIYDMYLKWKESL